jgi:hypothetical protein
LGTTPLATWFTENDLHARANQQRPLDKCSGTWISGAKDDKWDGSPLPTYGQMLEHKGQGLHFRYTGNQAQREKDMQYALQLRQQRAQEQAMANQTAIMQQQAAAIQQAANAQQQMADAQEQMAFQARMNQINQNNANLLGYNRPNITVNSYTVPRGQWVPVMPR